MATKKTVPGGLCDAEHKYPLMYEPEARVPPHLRPLRNRYWSLIHNKRFKEANRLLAKKYKP